MCLTGTLLRSVLVVLLLVNSSGKRGCNYEEILSTYREIIFVELQHLNLTASSSLLSQRNHCPSGKERGILASIYRMTQQVRCQSNGKKLSDLENPVWNMEQLIIQNCSPGFMVNEAFCSSIQHLARKKRKRPRLIKVLKALMRCWEKLQSVSLSSK